MGRGLGLAELGYKDELDQLGLELWLNWSLEDFPEWGGGGEKLGIKLKLRFGLGLAELGKKGWILKRIKKSALYALMVTPLKIFQQF